MVALLDVNVLIALFDPAHVHHEAAHTWFEVNRKYRWATCPLTENAFIRVLSNPSYPGQSTTIEDAVLRLSTFCSEREHVFGLILSAYVSADAFDGSTSRVTASLPTSTCSLWQYRIRHAWRPSTPPSHSIQLKGRKNRISNSYLVGS